MTIFTDGLRLESPDRPLSDFDVSLGTQLGATAAEAWSDSPTSQALGLIELNAARGNRVGMPETDPLGNVLGGPQELADGPPVPTLPRADAQERIKRQGLEKRLTLPQGDTIASPVLDIMISRAREHAEREATIARGPQGFLAGAAGLGTSFLVGAIDPINVGASFIPIMGELRYGKLLASAGESAISRAGIRAGVGAAQGAVGQAAIEPLDWYAHTQEGRDFGMSDVLHNLVFGAALGGAMHSAGGAVSDVLRRRRGEAVYPFGPGEPMEGVSGTHVPASVLSEEGVAGADLQPVLGHIANILGEPSTPPALRILQDLPPRAQEDSMRAAIAAIVDGEPVKVGELLEAAAKGDPRIAESLYHGSPHDFAAFDNSKIGSGEGAQAFAYGHYLAETEQVARGYQDLATRQLTGAEKEAAKAVAAAGGDIAKATKLLRSAVDFRDVSNAAADLLDRGWRPPQGNLYRVRIKPDRESFLQWETDLTDQPAGRMILEKMDPQLKANLDEYLEQHDQPALEDLTGGMLHRLLERYAGEGELPGVNGDGSHVKREASEYLRSLGVPGVTFLDQKSRRGGAFGDLDATAQGDKPTRNFVVFNDGDIEITHKNGEPVKKPEQSNVAKAKARGRAAADPETWSLNELLASKGGLRPDPELEAIYGGKRGPFVPGFGPLIRKNGMPLDEALTLAKQHGYFLDPHDADNGTAGVAGRTSLGLTPRDLLDALDKENRGQKQFKPGHLEATKFDAEQEKHVIMGALEQELENSGQDVSAIDPQLLNRTVEIVHREGVSDVLAAYERAIMEDHDRYEGLRNGRQQDDATADIPGWDYPDGGPASRAGETGSGERGEAGVSAEGSRQADGGEPRKLGNGHRAPGQGLTADDWHDLMRRADEVDDPDILEASRDADQAPEIPTRLDERVAAAEQADARAAELYKMFADELPESERTRLEEAIKTLDEEHGIESDVIERAAACAFRARVA